MAPEQGVTTSEFVTTYPQYPQDDWFQAAKNEQLKPSQRYRVQFRMGPIRRITFKVKAGSFGEAALLARQYLVAWEAEFPHEDSVVGDRWTVKFVEAY